MSLKLKSYLKTRFVTGSKPTETDYTDWLDSYVHFDDLAALNNLTIDARISQYDQSLRARNIDGTINSLGDVFEVLKGFSDTADIKGLLDAAGGAVTWGAVTGKPTAVNVTWEEQVVSLGGYTPGQPASYEAIQSKGCASFGQGALLQPATRFLVKDIFFSRLPYQVLQPSNIPSYYADRITAVVFAIGPKITLS